MIALFSFGRPGGRPTFRVGPIPVRVELSFWITAAVLGFLSGGSGARALIAAVAVFASVLLHELGHALAYRMRGGSAEVLLYGMGGVTISRREEPFRTGERVFTALAGPIAGLLFGGLVYVGTRLHPLVPKSTAEFTADWLLWVNVGWGVFNLLPILPMDGGHVLESLLGIRDEVRGRVWARYATIALVLVLAPLSYFLGQIWVALILGLFALQAFQTLPLVDPKRMQALQRPAQVEAPPPEAPDVIENLGRLHKLLGIDEPEQARAVAHQVLSAAKGYGARDQALRALAWLSIGEGKPQDALGYLSKTSPRFDDPLTWGTAIAATGDAVNALPHLARAYDRSADPQTVATYARCLVAAGQPDHARKLAGPESPLEVQRALAEALFRSRDYGGSAEISRRLFDRAGQPLDAYNLACAESRLGKADEALRSLRAAVDKGFADRAHLEEDPDLAPLRARAEWTEIVSRLPTPAA